jgi:Mobilization protein NikA
MARRAKGSRAFLFCEETMNKGRPPLPLDEAKSESFHIRLRRAEHRQVLRAAKRQGVTLSEFFRQRILATPPSSREAADKNGLLSHVSPRREGHLPG